jgi:hypothetical protein
MGFGHHRSPFGVPRIDAATAPDEETPRTAETDLDQLKPVLNTALRHGSIVDTPALSVNLRREKARPSYDTPRLGGSEAIGKIGNAPLSSVWHRCGLKFSRFICCRTTTDEDSVLGRLDDAAVIGIKERQFVKAEREIDGLGFAWIESDPREPFEAADGLFHACTDGADVALDDLGPAVVAPVAHVRQAHGASERRACGLVGQPRSQNGTKRNRSRRIPCPSALRSWQQSVPALAIGV